jgi:hypothetical protein
MERVQGVLILFSPDEEARIKPKLASESDKKKGLHLKGFPIEPGLCLPVFEFGNMGRLDHAYSGAPPARNIALHRVPSGCGPAAFALIGEIQTRWRRPGWLLSFHISAN